MQVIDWRTSKAGARVRVALWLRSEVGPGGIFTKAQLRDAFPRIEQIDRRMRDLRPEGWVIATYREDRSLAADELRLVKLGAKVWRPGYRSGTAPPITDKARRAVFAGDNYCCTYCGIGAGEIYGDDPLRAAKLSVAHVDTQASDSPDLMTMCDRCRAETPDVPSVASILAAVADLDEPDRQRLKSWIADGRRHVASAERIWSQYRRLPPVTRDQIAKHVRQR